jgi:hypothetical protein
MGCNVYKSWCLCVSCFISNFYKSISGDFEIFSAVFLLYLMVIDWTLIQIILLLLSLRKYLGVFTYNLFKKGTKDN